MATQKPKAIVNGDYAHQSLCQRTFGTVLFDDHDGGGGSSSSSDGTQDNGESRIKSQQDQHALYQENGYQCLEDGDDYGRGTDTFEVAGLEGQADGEGDERQSHLGDQIKVFQSFVRDHIQHAGTKDQTAYQITGNVGQLDFFGQTTKEQTTQ